MTTLNIQSLWDCIEIISQQTKHQKMMETMSQIFILLLIFLIYLGFQLTINSMYAAHQQMVIFATKTRILTKGQCPSKREHFCWLINQKYSCPKKTLTNILRRIFSLCFPIVLILSLPVMPWYFMYTIIMRMKHASTQKFFINLLMQWFL